MKPPTIYSIAQQLGLSPATVSRSLNGSPTVKEETRDRVLRAAESLGYIRNQQARALRQTSTRMIGLLVPDLTSEVFAVLASSIQLELHRRDYGLIIGQSLNQPDLDRNYLHAFQSQMVDGIIHAPCTPNGVDDAFATLSTPVVEIIRESDGGPRNAFCNADRGDSALITSYLARRGYEEIFVVLGPQEFSSARLRSEGAGKVRAAYPNVNLHLCHGPFTEEWGYQVGAQVASVSQARDSRVGIAVTSNTFMAGVLGALKDRGVSAPADVGIVGMEDPNWYRVANPPLTAVAEPTWELGRQASQRLLELIADGQGTEPVKRTELHGVLRERESTI
ncbi:MAG: LacI family DNA-binding transcriptional regulator [Mycobacterium sp.]